MKRKFRFPEKIHLLSQGITLLFHTSGLYMALILFLSIISALFPPLNAIMHQKLLDSIAQMVQAGSWEYSGLFFLAVSFLINIVVYALNGVQGLIKRIFSDKLDVNITVRILYKSLSFPMESFDSAKMYNHINTAITQTSSNCLNLLETISEIIYSTVKSLSFVYIILKFSWQTALISLISIIPVLHLSTQINRYWYKIYHERVEKKRLIEYLKTLMVKNGNVKEIKLYNVGEKIIKIITTQFSLFLKEDAKVHSAAPNGSWCGGQRQLSAANGSLN